MGKRTLSEKEISFPLLYATRRMCGFREAATLINLAKKCNTKIQIKHGDDVGDTDSIISLVSLELVPDSIVVINACGGNAQDALRNAISII